MAEPRQRRAADPAIDDLRRAVDHLRAATTELDKQMAIQAPMATMVSDLDKKVDDLIAFKNQMTGAYQATRTVQMIIGIVVGIIGIATAVGLLNGPR